MEAPKRTNIKLSLAGDKPFLRIYYKQKNQIITLSIIHIVEKGVCCLSVISDNITDKKSPLVVQEYLTPANFTDTKYS